MAGDKFIIFFFWYHSVHFLCSNGLQGLTRARTQKFPCLFFFSMFFLSQFRLHLFFLSNFRSFCTEWSKGEQQGKYAKEKSHFLAIIFCCSRSILECVCKFTNIFLIDKFFFHIFPFFYEEQGIFFFVVSK